MLVKEATGVANEELDIRWLNLSKEGGHLFVPTVHYGLAALALLRC